MCDVAGVLSAILVIVQLSLSSGGTVTATSAAQRGVAAVQMLLTTAYAVELCVRAVRWARRRQQQTQARAALGTAVFEACVCIAVSIGFVLRAIVYAGRATLLLESVALLRVVRVLRRSAGFNAVLTSVGDVVPALMRYVAALLCLFYAYAMVGQDLFGGRLVSSDPDVAASPYGDVACACGVGSRGLMFVTWLC